MGSAYVDRLIKRVINLSQSNTWDCAVKEWEIYDCVEDETLSESCICGKENLYYLFTIRNTVNGNMLFPIGSSCIKKFGRNELTDKAKIREKMFKLYHAVEDDRYITLSPEFFSRKLINTLYDEGAFDSKYNKYDGYDDYEFLLKMFNKKDKSEITLRQEKKIRAIIVASIRPYLQNKIIKNKSPRNNFRWS